MTPITFGSDARKLFGVLNARPAATAPRCAVILCNAFGREAIRAHRLYRVLAERLSRAGCDVLRFDYFGTGDSAGDDGAVDVAGFTADLLTAHAELAQRSRAPRVLWTGMRLGANVVQAAAEQAPADLARIILWDPIADGRDYLDRLRARHLEWEAEGRAPLGAIAPVFRAQPDFYMSEAIGFPLSRTFIDQLRALRFTPPPATRFETEVIAEPDTEEGRAILAACRAPATGARVSEVAHGTDWTNEADSTGLVPPAVMNLLFEKSGGRA